jgi:hypothetical protein
MRRQVGRRMRVHSLNWNCQKHEKTHNIVIKTMVSGRIAATFRFGTTRSTS